MFNISCHEKEIQINYKNRHNWFSTELEKMGLEEGTRQIVVGVFRFHFWP